MVREIEEIERELGLHEALGMESSALTIRVDSRRYGKNVTVVDGFDPSVDLDRVAKDLKNALGVGGTVKDGHIELQGDHRRAVRPILEKQGFHITA